MHLRNQASAVVEEVTDEILSNLIEDHEYVFLKSGLSTI